MVDRQLRSPLPSSPESQAVEAPAVSKVNLADRPAADILPVIGSRLPAADIDWQAAVPHKELPADKDLSGKRDCHCVCRAAV